MLHHNTISADQLQLCGQEKAPLLGDEAQGRLGVNSFTMGGSNNPIRARYLKLNRDCNMVQGKLVNNWGKYVFVLLFSLFVYRAHFKAHWKHPIGVKLFPGIFYPPIPGTSNWAPCSDERDTRQVDLISRPKYNSS